MAIITQLKQQEDKNRVNVYLDNKFGFGIDLDNFVLLNLKLNQELNEQEIEEIIKKAEFQKTFDRVFKWSTSRPHSEKEIKDYLKRKKVPNVLYKDLFEKLSQFGVVNDEEFARFWIESRNSFNAKPKKVLRMELKMKGINDEIMNKMLENTQIDEEKMALNLLQKRKIHFENIEKTKRKQKMIAYLAGRGFAFELAKKTIERYNSGEDE
ncbi:MAG TPA: RecX family transcriptional regulator [Patescibacteria group bacterium]|nr:RecX family transcriptional regulator [Patescibacteria group bacterium]